MCRPIGASARALAADSPRDLSDAVSVEDITQGLRNCEPGIPIMSNIPLDLQRRFERRWSARLASASAAPKSIDLKNTVNSLPPPAKDNEKTRRAEPAGLVSIGTDELLART